jgi:hypothetical protein
MQLVVPVLAFVITGCVTPADLGPSPREGADIVTPDEAFVELQDDLVAVANAISPGHDALFNSPERDRPCGGVAGADWSHVMSSSRGGLGWREWDNDREAALERIGRAGRDRGYNVLPPNVRGDKVDVTLLRGDFILGVTIRGDGTVIFSGSTPCLRNPEEA